MSPLLTFKDNESEMTCLLFLKGCQLLVTGSENGLIKWWNPDSGSFISAGSHSNTVSCMDYVEKERDDVIVSCDYDGVLCIWYCQKKKTMKPRLDATIETGHGIDSEILAVKWIKSMYNSEETWLICSGGNDRIIRIWDYTNHIKCLELKSHRDSVTCFNYESNFLFSGSEDGEIIIWNIRILKDSYKVCSFKAHNENVRCIRMLDSGFFMTCSFDHTIRVWDYDPERINQRKIEKEKIKDDSEDEYTDDLKKIEKEVKDNDLLELTDANIENIYTIRHNYKCWCVTDLKEEDKTSLYCGMNDGCIVKYNIENSIFELNNDENNM